MKNYFRDAGSFAASDGGDVVHVFVVGPIQTNCYAYVSAGEALVVDPGAVGARIATALAGEKVVCVAATHGHGDHVGGVAALVSATGAPFAISAADAEMAKHAGDPAYSGSGIAYDDDAPEPSRLLAEGNVLAVGTARFRVMETPGHTPGGICLVGEGTAEGIAFVGDTLFRGRAVALTLQVETRTPCAVRLHVWAARSRHRRCFSAGTVLPPRWPRSWRATPSCASAACNFFAGQRDSIARQLNPVLAVVVARQPLTTR